MRPNAAWMLVALLAGTAAGAANIRKIELVGFQRVDAEAIRRDLPVQIGETFDEQRAEEARLWLVERGLFVDVKLAVATEGDVRDMTFTVVENPRVRAVQIEGNTQLAAAAIRPSLATRPASLLDRRAISRDAGVIGTAYLQRGFFVNVLPRCEPEPTGPDQLVTVIFRVLELKVRAVRCEPVGYLRAEKLAEVFSLKPGDLLERRALIEQQARLAGLGLFDGVNEAQTVEGEDHEHVDVLYEIELADRPWLRADNLPLVDVAKLVQYARFPAVSLTVSGDDLAPFAPPDELERQLSAARQAGDRPAVFALTRRLGRPLGEAAEAAVAALTARPAEQRSTAEWLTLARAYEALGRVDEAVAALAPVTADPVLRCAAYAHLVSLHAGRLRAVGEEALRPLQEAVTAGSEAALALPSAPSLDQLTDACTFYYNALGASLLNIGLKQRLRLDGPLGRTLMGSIYRYATRPPPDAELRQLGKLVTAIAFVARNLRADLAGPDTWQEFLGLLDASRTRLLGPGLAECRDPGAFFFAALADLMLGNAPGARAAAHQGLVLGPDDARLIDLFVLSALESPLSALDRQKSLEALEFLVRDLGHQPAAARDDWGSAMLACKLNLALRDALDEGSPRREAARQAAEQAARAALAQRPEHPEAWWLLGLAQLKGPRPADALETYARLEALAPGYRDTGYARALALLACGRTEEGLAAMAALLTGQSPTTR